MSNEALARFKSDALLAAQRWNTQDRNAVRVEVVLTAQAAVPVVVNT